jgi:hypothetical protein
MRCVGERKGEGETGAHRDDGDVVDEVRHVVEDVSVRNK